MEPFSPFFLSCGFPALALLAVGLGAAAMRTRYRRFLKQWRPLLQQHGLFVLESSKPWSLQMSLTARAGKAEVRIEHIPKRGLRVQLGVPGLLGYSGMKLRRESFRPAGREIETGDEPFDRTFVVEGDTGMVTALLDEKTRRLLLQANVEGALELRGGWISVQASDATLPRLLPDLLELGQRLTQGASIVRRLAENARREPEAGVRLRNLLLLAREHPGETVTAETLRAACRDKDPQVRLRAAIELGAEGRETLVTLAESAGADVWRAQAVAALGRQLPWERTAALLQQALQSGQPETARACLAVLGQWQGAALGDLARVLEREADDLAAAAATALAETGEAAAEPPLLRALDHGSREVRTAAAIALGRVGTAAAVLPLQRAAEDDRGVRRAARQAIAEIQSRLQGAAPGQLSLADAEAGQLSLAPAEAGQLSLAPEPAAGPLSLPPERQRA